MGTQASGQSDEIDLFDKYFGDSESDFDSELEDNADRDDNLDVNGMMVSLEVVTKGGRDSVEVYAHGEAHSEEDMRKVLLAVVTDSELTMFPLVSRSYRSDFLDPKYGDLATFKILADAENPWSLPESILDFDELLMSLPVGFGRHAKYGLGLKWEYRLIPDAIREAAPEIIELVIVPGSDARLDGNQFYLGEDRFTAIRRSIDTITRRASHRSLQERRSLTFNELLHTADSDRFQRKYPIFKPGEVYEMVKLGGNRSAGHRHAATSIILDDADKIAKEQPVQLLELRSAIEQATLNELITKIESMLDKKLTEAKWQDFFKKYPFILGLAFPHPVMLIQDQAHVGGTMLRGAGESIVDFLFAQRFTGNLALIEIKRPSTLLLESRPFRGDLYAPHKELTSAMAQVLDQRFQLLNNFATKSHDPSLKDTHVSAVHCVVIVGRVPSTIEEKRSFDLFRHSSKDVVVVTFDELLAKLKEILRLMTASLPPTTGSTSVRGDAVASPSQEDDVPF